jgi:1,2-diacylglycerol 3-alpha-glucosyltransferase
MRIIIFTDTFLPQINGVVTYVLETSKILAARGHKILIFAPQSKGSGKINLNNPNIEVIASPSIEFPTYKEYKIALPSVMKYYKIAEKFHPDVFHIQSPFSLGLAGLYIAKGMAKPVVSTYHTLLPDFIKYYLPIPILKDGNLINDFTWRLSNYFYNRCDLVLTPSGIMRDMLVKHDIKVPVQVLSNGIDLDVFKPESQDTKNLIKDRFGLGNITLIHSGRMSFEKNIQVLIKAFALIRKNIDKDVKFLMIGDGPALSDLKKIAADLKVSQDMIFTGYLSRKFLLAFLKSSDIFVTASTMETQGIVVLEAMATGMAVIGADKMALPELIKDGVNGYLFKPGNEKMLAEKMLKVIQSDKLRAKMAANSLDLVKAHSINLTIEKLEKIYSDLIKNKRNKNSDFNI